VRYVVTAAYASWCSDAPQVYEPGVVEADSSEHAEMVAEMQCREDNGYLPSEEPPSENLLTDVFAREVPRCPHCGEEIVE
jgi:hypothetical protein